MLRKKFIDFIQFLKSFLKEKYSVSSLENIKGIQFTSREIDVMACLLVIRSNKAIASCLKIEEKTVEHYMRVLRGKINCNSREGIVKFIEKSGTFLLFRQYFQQLLVKNPDYQFSMTETLPKKSILGNLRLKTIAIFCGCIIGLSIFIYMTYTDTSQTIRSDLLIPTEAAFLKRPNLVTQIEKRLNGSQGIQTVALVGIVGMGGVGKTTLARYFGRSQKSSVVWEINAETKDSLINSFKDLAYALAQTKEHKETLDFIQKIQNPEEKEKQIISFVKQHLKEKQQWFLIYDNVETLSDIKNYFPQDPNVWGFGKVIVTTRDTNIKNTSFIKPENIIQLEELDQQETLTLFSKILYEITPNKLSADQKEKVIKFLQNIPPFPLDVSVAAYYIKNSQITYEQYLERIAHYSQSFENAQQALLKETSDYTETRYGIITSSLEKLIHTNPEFKELLLLVSLLDSQHIPKDLLDIYKNSAVVDKFTYHLRKYSLLSFDQHLPSATAPSYSIHRSTRAILLAYLTKKLDLEKNHHFLKKITYALEKYSAALADTDDLARMKVIKGHFEKFLSHKNLLTPSLEGSIGGELGYIYYSLGYSTAGKKLLQESLIQLKYAPQENHHRIALLLFYLANIYWNLSEYELAKDCLEESIQLYKTHLPNDKLSLARAWSCLGIIYDELGNHSKAKDTLEMSLSTYQKYLPQNYTAIAQAVVYLGIIHRSIGNYAEGVKLLGEALTIYQTHLPENHIAFAWTLINLASIKRDLGYYEEAHGLYEKALTLYKKHLPGNQIEIGRIFVRIGNVSRDLGYYEKAKNYLEKSLKIYKVHLPETHIAIGLALAYLGNVYRSEGNYEKAQELLEKGLQLYRNCVPDHCIKVAQIKMYLGTIYGDTGNYKKAHELLKESLSAYEKHYGNSHIEMARIFHSLGQVYLLENDLVEAELYLQKALEIFKRDGHTDGYSVLEDLAHLYLKKSKAAEIGRNTLEARTNEKQATILLNNALEIIKERLPKDSIHNLRIQSKLQKS